MILVTGATGLVGSHLIAQLCKTHKNIRAIYRSDQKKEQAKRVFLHYHNDATAFDKIDWILADINDIPTLETVFKGITHVYHCAAMISFNPDHYKKLRKINIEGTANIVNLSIANQIQKLCYVSSIATLGDDPTKNYFDEENDWNPESLNSVYAITKYGAEMEVWRGTQEGLNAVIVNPGVIIGSGFFNSGSGSLFSKINKGFNYYTCGVTGYVAIEDVVTPMITLMNGDYTNERYILVSENLSFKSIFSSMARALGKSAPKKKVSPFIFQIAWRLQWAAYKTLGITPSIYKTTAKSAFTNCLYKNDKLKKALNYSFIPIEESIKKTAILFLQE